MDLQHTGTFEGACRQGLHIFRDGDLRQGSASLEAIVSNISQAVRELNLCERPGMWSQS